MTFTMSHSCVTFSYRTNNHIYCIPISLFRQYVQRKLWQLKNIQKESETETTHKHAVSLVKRQLF